MKGSVHGGQQPIAGAHVYLFAAPSTGTAVASTSLLNSSATGTSDSVGAYVTTDANGYFSITNDYTCPSGSQAYLYVLGGNAGSGSNSFIGELAVLGTCPSSGSFASSIPFIQVNELTTVAAAYAMAGFAFDAVHVSSNSTTLAKAGLANAFANAGNLVSITSGAALVTTPGGNGTVPSTLINTLGDILAACINSNGAASTQCGALTNSARSGGATGSTSSDTATIAINIAHYPGANVAALLSLITPAAPFQPTLGSVNDFSIGINYTGGGLNQPYTVAIDASGNAWTANGNGPGISKFSPLGVALSGTTGFVATSSGVSNAVALDSNGNAFAVNGTGLVTKFSNLGVPLSGTGYNPAGAGTILGVSVDGNQNVWIANFNNPSGIDVLTNTGGTPANTAAQPITGGGISGPIATAIDTSNNIWIANYSGSSISKLSNAGAVISTAPYTGGGLSKPNFIAIDGTNNVWTANSGNNTVSKFNSAGTAVSTSTGFTGGGLATPTGIAVDGNNQIWVSNGAGGVSAFSNTGVPLSPSAGFTGGSFANPQGVAVDASGNLWVPNNATNTITQVIGIATPTVVPLATAINTNTLGARP